MRYANYEHSHEEYLTRRKTLELIQQVLLDHPDILTKLQAISDYLVENAPELATLASKTDIAALQAQIDTLNSIGYKEQLVDFIEANTTLNSDQIITEFIDATTQDKKNLEQVLQELYDDIQRSEYYWS